MIIGIQMKREEPFYDNFKLKKPFDPHCLYGNISAL